MKPLLIVDGYNVIGAWKEAREWTQEEGRDRLLHRLEDYGGYAGEEICLVFDGYKSDRRESTIDRHGDVTVVFTKHGETADSYIERMAAIQPKYRRIRVATSDGLEQSQVLSTGAIRMTSPELIRELNQMRREGMEQHKAVSGRQKSTIGSAVSDEAKAKLEKMRREK